MLLCFNATAQTSISFIPELNDSSIQIETLRFYISDISFLDNSETVYTPGQKYFLVDIDKPESQHIKFDTKKDLNFNAIRFHLGIDSLTNVSGALGGALDPTNGMYWTWQSGYINFKLEGKSDKCPARNHLFQFHLGGYQHPLNAYRTVELAVSPKKEITIQLAIDKLLEQVDVATTYEVMSPGEKAMEISTLISSLFHEKR